MYSINNNILFYKGSQIKQYPTSSMGGIITPKYLVIHYTAAGADAHGIGKYFQNPANKVSAHLNLSEDGEFTQSVPFNRSAWHAGRSSWDGINGLNNHSIGIEVCNPGPLEKLTNGRYKSWWGKIYTDEEYNIIKARHQNGSPDAYWIPFSAEQNEALLDAGKLLMNQYNLKEAVGHDMISPGRKTDPGPCIDQRIYDRLNGGRESSPTDFGDHEVTANLLNLRSKPDTNATIIGRLKKGDKVDKLNQSGHWFYVETEDGFFGYIHSNFVKKI